MRVGSLTAGLKKTHMLTEREKEKVAKAMWTRQDLEEEKGYSLYLIIIIIADSHALRHHLLGYVMRSANMQDIQHCYKP